MTPDCEKDPMAVTVRISANAAADKARLLESSGWQVHITALAGRQFEVSDFHRFWINHREHAYLARSSESGASGTYKFSQSFSRARSLPVYLGAWG